MNHYTKQAIPDSAIPRITRARAAARLGDTLSIGQIMQERARARWSKYVNALIPPASGAGDHEADVEIARGATAPTAPTTRYDTYRGKSPCKAYGYGTACSTATIVLPIGWEIAVEDHATVARRARWHAHTLAERQERHIVLQSGKYGLKLVRGWFLSGRHIEISDRARALRKAREMSAARRTAKAGAAGALHDYGREDMSISDSLAAGNCRSGSEAWARKYFGARTSATIAEVMLAAMGSGERRAEIAAKVAMRRADRELAELALMSAIA